MPVTVHFIGVSPGAADLMTMRGHRLLSTTPVCLYVGSLVQQEMLEACPPGARIVDTALMTLDQIIEEMWSSHLQGDDVARLASGDMSVFSAMAEQIRRLDELGVPNVTPGVPAYAAAAAALKGPWTVPTVGQTVTLTRIAARATPMPAAESVESLGPASGTLIVHLAVHRVDELVERLAPSLGATCPAAVVAHSSTAQEIVLRGTVGRLVRGAGIRRTAVILVGRALAARHFPDSHLYSAGRCRQSLPEPDPSVAS